MGALGEGWVLLRVVNDESEAHLVKGLLEGEGIVCRLQSMRVPQYPITVDGLGELHIYVPEEQLMEGRRVLAAVTKRPVD